MKGWAESVGLGWRKEGIKEGRKEGGDVLGLGGEFAVDERVGDHVLDCVTVPHGS